LAHTHHLIVNEHELEALVGRPSEPTELESAARSLLELGPQAVTVTLGAQGSLTVTAETTDRMAAHPVQVVDTTGAGDTFCGVLAARVSAEDSLPAALHWAGLAAGLACTRPGAQDSMPNWEEVLEAQVLR
jgi:ribokinase